MTGYSHHDERMIDWLEQGPWDPPPELVDAAVAYARRHPRRGTRLSGLRRSLMSGIHLAPVQQRPAANRSLFIALATVAAVVVVTIGLVGGMNLLGPRDQTGGTTSSSPPSAATSTSPTPVAISGSMSGCETTSGPVTRMAGEILQTRNHAVRCRLWSADERLEGTVALVYNSDRESRADVGLETPSPDDFVEAAWGTIALETGDGRWTGVWRGTHDLEGYFRHYALSGVLVGQGELDGLRVRWTLENTGPNVSADLLEANFRLAGTLEPVDTIPPNGTTLISGSPTCRSVESGTESVVDGVTQVRGLVLECPGVGSDPRLDGLVRSVVNIDRVADGSATMWGTEGITLDGQVTWRGEYTGTVAVGYTTHNLAGTYIGYGPYAGLVYEWTTIGDPATGYVTSGTIKPAP